MERERRTAQTQSESIQKPEERQARSEPRSAGFTPPEGALLAAIRGGDVEALLAADPEQIKALSRMAGNAAVAALLRGDAPLISAQVLPPMEPGTDANRIRTRPPALIDALPEIDGEHGMPNRIGDMSAHMGIF